MILWGKICKSNYFKVQILIFEDIIRGSIDFYRTLYSKNEIIKLILTYFNIMLLVKGSRKLYKHSQV